MRFSILTLLAAIAYVAIMIQAIKEADSIWPPVATIAILLVSVAMALAAFHPLNRAANYFGRVAIVCLAIYFVLERFGETQSYLPHEAFANWYLLWDAPEGASLGADGNYVFLGSNLSRQLRQLSPFGVYRTEPFVGLLSAQVFGLLAGSLALFRYQRISATPPDATRNQS